MVLRYQTLKNLCDKATRGRASMTTDAVNLVGEIVEQDIQELIDEAIDLVKISKKKRIASIHILKAVKTIKERR